MNRRVIIEQCDQCPFFDNEYYGYDETCTKLDRKIKSNEHYEHNIPDDCPLHVTDEEADS